MSAQVAKRQTTEPAPAEQVRGEGEDALGSSELARIYEQHFRFVWRSARRLGVGEATVDDVVQEVFLVVHRQLSTFERRSSLKTWLYGILRHVVRNHLRHAGRRRHEPLEEASVGDGTSPFEEAARAQAVTLLAELLDELDDDKREVFVLAELEEMSVPEIAEALGVKMNTVYSRLRLARRAVERALDRRRKRDQWRDR